MKRSMKQYTLILGLMALTATAHGQKKNVTTAAVEYGKLRPMLLDPRGMDIEGAKKSALVAQKFIDLAAAHPDTKEDQKMFLKKGQIYTAIAMIDKMDSSYTEATSADHFNTAITAFKMGFQNGGKKTRDIEDAVRESRAYFTRLGDMSWEAKNYGEAGELFEYAARYFDAIGVLDTTVIYYAGVGYENGDNNEGAARMYDQLAAVDYKGARGATLAASIHKKLGNEERSIALLQGAQQKFPNDREVLLGLVNAYIDAGNSTGAEKALSDAIATDPNNEKLHYNSGTIYINLGDQARKEADETEDEEIKAQKLASCAEAYQKAETALTKALEIKPDYVDAQYQLGAHLYNWASQLRQQAAFLKVGDPREASLNKMTEEKTDASIVALEKYIENAPNDKGILRILWKAYYKKGDTEKANQYKARLDAAK